MQILMRMADYVEYAAAQHDENPLYIFDRYVHGSLNVRQYTSSWQVFA